MLRRKKKTGVQVAREITENFTEHAARIGAQALPISFICKVCIFLLSISISFGFYGLFSRINDVSKKQHHIDSLKEELADLEHELEQKRMLQTQLVSDPLAIEAVARSYGMSKKGERIFYFLD